MISLHACKKGSTLVGVGKPERLIRWEVFGKFMWLLGELSLLIVIELEFRHIRKRNITCHLVFLPCCAWCDARMMSSILPFMKLTVVNFIMHGGHVKLGVKKDLSHLTSRRFSMGWWHTYTAYLHSHSHYTWGLRESWWASCTHPRHLRNSTWL